MKQCTEIDDLGTMFEGNQPRTVLVLHEDEEMRKQLESKLTEAHFNVLMAVDQSDCFEQWRLLRMVINLTVIDLASSSQLIQQMKALDPKTKIAVFSSAVLAEDPDKIEAGTPVLSLDQGSWVWFIMHVDELTSEIADGQEPELVPVCGRCQKVCQDGTWQQLNGKTVTLLLEHSCCPVCRSIIGQSEGETNT
ncbi:MAG: hypothetical protein CMI53_00190 [Parcubacteria group bacterium]|jgi:hypothetical protein|nr:hypothetical protein [Parcubacteria group bacterium]|tara:strand:- start:4961 stop:5539 length:579 start_codon:yes stop_codon:yes gene_type:complete